MLHTNEFPVLEFDDNPVAQINPLELADTQLSTDKLVITFFPEVIEKLVNEDKIAPELIINGENPVTLYKFRDADVLLTLGQVGCPACGGNLDVFYGFGARRVMFCGGGGVLDRSIGVGQPLLVDSAIRDEGFSYQYVAPSRYIYANKEVNDRVAAALERRGVSYLRGRVWTTDSLFRETKDRIAARKAEGAQIVEMEQAGNLAVAQTRGFRYAALIYGGDDVSGESWDERSWRSHDGIRWDLVQLCKELVMEM